MIIRAHLKYTASSYFNMCAYDQRFLKAWLLPHSCSYFLLLLLLPHSISLLLLTFTYFLPLLPPYIHMSYLERRVYSSLHLTHVNIRWKEGSKEESKEEVRCGSIYARLQTQDLYYRARYRVWKSTCCYPWTFLSPQHSSLINFI